MVPGWSHVFVMVSVFWVGKCNEKIRKDPEILLAPLKVMPQNHKKTHASYIFASKYTEMPKRSQDRKLIFWKTSIVINKFGSNCHVICQAPRDIVDQSSDFFYGCTFSEVIWHGVQITFFQYRIMFSRVYILEIKTNFHVISIQNGDTH